MQWDKRVGLDDLLHIHEALQINLLVFNINDIPILGHTQQLKICSSLVFKSEQKYKNTYFLLFDDEIKHYDCITNITGFLACRHFCSSCLKSFTDTPAFHNHKCGEDMNQLQRKEKNKGKMKEELRHYLKRKYTSGSVGEINDYSVQRHCRRRY